MARIYIYGEREVIMTDGDYGADRSAALEQLLVKPITVKDLDISSAIVIDIIMRILFQEGGASVQRIATITLLDVEILDELLAGLLDEALVEVARAGSMGRLSYTYQLTDQGKGRADEALDRSQYIGPAPIPVEKYVAGIQLQTHEHPMMTPDDFKDALRHLILPENFERRIGPAVNQRSALFLYGPPGNGKTTIAEAIAEMISGSESIWLPYALSLSGHIINIYDPLVHRPVRDIQIPPGIDLRWGYFHRPIVIAGGELKLEALELRFDPVAKYYEAPLQLKSNGGMFLIDDFGRQAMRPADLLNRWIVPLETRIDYLRLRTGQTLEIPFRQLVVFATNLDPLDLADDAFLRRIPMKVRVDEPNERRFYTIFDVFAQQYGLEVNRDAFVHLLQRHYRETGRAMQSVHPRDLLKIVVALCEFEGVPPYLSPEILDEACAVYFVKDEKQPWATAEMSIGT